MNAMFRATCISLLMTLAACAQTEEESQPAQQLADELVTILEPAPEHRRSQGEDWTTFLGPRGDGTSTETGLDPSRWNPHPPIVWTKRLGVSYGAPTIAQGRLLQFDRFGSSERLSCFDAAVGTELWRSESIVQYDDMYGYNNGPRCCPVVDGDLVFTYGVSGRLACTHLKTGKLIWATETVDHYAVVQNFFGVASTPCVFDDLLLVMVGGSPPESHQVTPGQLDAVKPNGSAIVAFNKSTGKEVYRLGDDLASYASVQVRNINGNPTGLAFLRDGLLAWDPGTGKERFRFDWRSPRLESVNAAQPVVNGNQIMLSETYDIGSVVLKVDGDEPQVVRQDPRQRREQSFRAHWSTPVVIDGFLYGCSGRNQPDSDFRCVRWDTGEVMWSTWRHDRSSVVSVDGYLIALGEQGRLVLFKPTPERFEPIADVELSEVIDPSDGQPLLSEPCWAAPVISNGLLYLRGRNRLVCFDLIPSATAAKKN